MERTDQQKTEDKAEAIARRLAREAGRPEALWELFLLDAYLEMTRPAPDEGVEGRGGS
jgi:hypothetical protein